VREAGFETMVGSLTQWTSVREPHHVYAAPAPGKTFDAALAAPAHTLLYSKAKFLNELMFKQMLKLSCS
jgi:hypothetical protein